MIEYWIIVLINVLRITCNCAHSWGIWQKTGQLKKGQVKHIGSKGENKQYDRQRSLATWT